MENYLTDLHCACTCSPQQVFDHYMRQVNKLGFFYMFYGCHIPQLTSDKPYEIILHNYPNGWFEYYEDQSFRECDPCLKHTFSSNLLKIWTKEFFKDNFKSQVLFEEANHAGIKHGCTIPVHGFKGDVATISLATSSSLSDSFWDLERLAKLQFIAINMHDDFVKSIQNHTAYKNTNNVALTPREKEILKWTVAGKSAWEISNILGISERTVRFHIDNILIKLDVSNKNQAVARAVSLHLA